MQTEVHPSKRSGILWSHNERTFPTWLARLKEGFKHQDFMWWDVGWNIKVNQFIFPVIGYIWRSPLGRITHRLLIQSIVSLRQPERELAEEVDENWRRLGVRIHFHDPLHEYLRSERKMLTLLKLTKEEELLTPLGLEDFKLWNGKTITHPPQGYYRIMSVVR